MVLDDLRRFINYHDERDQFTIYTADLEKMTSTDRAAVSHLLVYAASTGMFFFEDRVDEKIIRKIATLYKGEPDARQEGNIAPSVFRPRYRKLLDHELALHDAIKTKAQELWDLFDRVENKGRYVALGKTALEEGVMWAVKDLTK